MKRLVITALLLTACFGIAEAQESITRRSFPVSEAGRIDLAAREREALRAVLSPCTTTSTTLCLQDGRFSVGVGWQTQDGTVGQGQAVQLTGDSGYFWFFNSANIELVVKVLNACSPPFNRYWVFAAGLTNVEFTIAVLDRNSGQINTYTNPQGRPAPPLQDTNAFNTCP